MLEGYIFKRGNILTLNNDCSARVLTIRNIGKREGDGGST